MVRIPTLGSVGKLYRRARERAFFRLAKTAKQAMLVLSSMQPDAARRKTSRSKLDRVFRLSLLALLISLAWVGCSDRVENAGSPPAYDADFDTQVKAPAFVHQQPKVLFDEGHYNYHTVDGLYKGFAELVRSDGYQVSRNMVAFSPTALDGFEILVIVNPQGGESVPVAAEPAFSEIECDVVYDWVHAGGCLLLITDHWPVGAAAERLGRRFGVEMSAAHTIDQENFEAAGNPGWLVFSRENGLLGDHSILRGRNPHETIRRVTTFMGQSLKGPEGSVALLRLADSAEDAHPPEGETRVSARGRAQALALEVGKGRAVILGEAAMLSAQIRHVTGKGAVSVGMTFPGSDNRQLALNIMHWLSGLLVKEAYRADNIVAPPRLLTDHPNRD